MELQGHHILLGAGALAIVAVSASAMTVSNTILASSSNSSSYSNSSTHSVQCLAIHGKPDPSCTPGKTNPDVTQANIVTNICNKNWSTKSIRPSVSYTNDLKAKQMVQYGDTGVLSDYEEDHLISLEIGGSPTDPQNLWPEPWTLIVNGKDQGAHAKDVVENRCHKLICNGLLILAEAQKEIASDWTTACQSTLLK